MSELRERLAAKRRRQITVPVALEDATGAVAEASRIERDLLMASARGDKDDEKRLRAELEDAKVKLSEFYADVAFIACSPADFEELQTDFTSKDGGVDPEKLRNNLPAMIVACVVDDDLRDEEFWREQLDSGSWSYGERVNLANRLVQLNVAAPDERIPFA